MNEFFGVGRELAGAHHDRTRCSLDRHGAIKLAYHCDADADRAPLLALHQAELDTPAQFDIDAAIGDILTSQTHLESLLAEVLADQ
nr:hypothetical protein [Hydrocarboniphaga sp.]